MKRKIIIGTIILFILLMVSATIVLAHPTLPFIKFEIEQEIPSSFPAGSTQTFITSFDLPHALNLTYVFNLTITSTDTLPVWKGDFNVSGILNSILKTDGSQKDFVLDCSEISNGTFYCWNTSLATMPPSTNKVILNVTSEPNLLPGNYNFTFDFAVTRRVGVNVTAVSRSQTIYRGVNPLNTTLSDLEINVISKSTADVSFQIVSYVESFLLPPKPNFIRMFEIEPDENLTNSMVLAEIILEIVPNQLVSIDRNTISIYYWDGTAWVEYTNWFWMDDTHIKITTTHFSIWGVFGSPSSIPGPTTYLPGGTRYRNVTQNVTEEKEKVPAEAVCGNGFCESGETCSSCPEDCSCPADQECVDGVCTQVIIAPPAPSGLEAFTGKFVAIVQNPVYFALLALLVIAVILGIFKIRSKSLGHKRQ